MVEIQQVIDAIHHHLGERPSQLSPITTHPDTLVYAAELSGQSVIFKAHAPDSAEACTIATEAWMCQTVNAANIPAPAVLAVDTRKQLFPSEFFIMQKLHGRPLDTAKVTADVKHKLLIQAGELLRQIHTIAIDGFGLLDETHYRQSGVAKGGDMSWSVAILKPIAAALDYLTRTHMLDYGAVSAVQSLIGEHVDVIEAVTEANLLHGDLGLNHIIVDTEAETVVGLIDFGERSGGDPIWDLATFDWARGANYEALLEGYAPSPDDYQALRDRFGLYSVLQAVPWAHRWHLRGYTHVIDVMKGVIRLYCD